MKPTVNLIAQAKEYLIQNHVTHLDQLAHKLMEARVCRVIEPILAGTAILEASTAAVTSRPLPSAPPRPRRRARGAGASRSSVPDAG